MLQKIGLLTILSGLFLALISTTLLSVGINTGAPVVILIVALYVVLAGVALLTAAVTKSNE